MNVLANLLILVYLSNFIFTLECSEDDIGKHLTKCNKEGKRKILFFWKNECITNNSNSTSSPSTQLPFMLDNIPCDLQCAHGEFITYDITQHKQVCLKCKANSYSVGGDFRICGEKREWTDELFTNNGFINECYTVNISESDNEENSLQNSLQNSLHNNFTTNIHAKQNLNKTNCRNWQINNFRTNLTTGGTDAANVFYVASLKYNVELKNEGKIVFGYEKKTVRELDYFNGQFKFFIDYNEKLHDQKLSREFQDVEFSLEKGSHSFMWVYFYKTGDKEESNMSDMSDMDLRMELKYILINGIEDAAYECLQCNRANQVGFSKEGWDHCEVCPSLQYLDQTENQCKDCPSDTFSFPNSIGQNSCITRPKCNELDYKEIHSECVDNQKIVSYEFEDPVFCGKGNFTLPQERNETCDSDICPLGFFFDGVKCLPCPVGEYSDTVGSLQCLQCPSNTTAVKVLNISKFHNNENKENIFDNLKFVNECKSEFYSGLCDIYNHTGWKVRKEGLVPGNNLPHGVNLTLSKNVIIVNKNAYVEIEYEIYTISEEEHFFVELNAKPVENLNLMQGIHKIKIEMPLSGQNLIKIVYQKRRAAVLNLDNPMIIKSFVIFGSDEGGAKECITEVSEVIQINTNTTAEINSTSNETLNESEQLVDSECPDFSFLDPVTQKCKLNDIIHNKQFSLKFFAGNLKKKIEKICENDSSEICYNKNKFTGPIHDTRRNDIFFISFDQKDKIHVQDFSYIKEKDFKYDGYIFGLFEQKEHNIKVESSTKNPNRQHYNLKLLKNLGSKLSKIILIPHRQKLGISPGIMIKYTNGDKCIEDAAKNYTSTIFITCDKSGVYYPPKLLSKIASNCSFIFEWESRFGCPACVKGEAIETETGCVSGRESILYEETTSCIIEEAKAAEGLFNTTCDDCILSYTTYKENEAAMSEYLLFNKVFNTKIGNKTSLEETIKNIDNILTAGNNNNSDRTYIENFKETKACVLPKLNTDNTEDSTFQFIFVFLVPGIYIITSICLIIFYCKYRKLNSHYERLRQEVGDSSNYTREGEDAHNLNSMRNRNTVELDNLDLEDPDHES